jgi:RNA polymerase sigma-70 factor (ECF subfamily)
MEETDWLASQFEGQRSRLRGVAYRMLGSLSEAEDAVQEAWLRASRAGTEDVENLNGWLTTVVARVCLDALRARKARREEPLESYVPDPIVVREAGTDPEREALLADAIGLALLVVLETLGPAERLAFVLHDMFGVPFEEIAPIVERTPTAARQLASRARRRVQGAGAVPDPDLSRQQEVVNAFLAASRAGDFETLLTVLDPDVVMRVDRGAATDLPSRVIRGADGVAGLGWRFAGGGFAPYPALVNGAPGLVIRRHGQLFSVISFTVHGGKITAINVMADPERINGVEVVG